MSKFLYAGLLGAGLALMGCGGGGGTSPVSPAQQTEIYTPGPRLDLSADEAKKAHSYFNGAECKAAGPEKELPDICAALADFTKDDTNGNYLCPDLGGATVLTLDRRTKDIKVFGVTGASVGDTICAENRYPSSGSLLPATIDEMYKGIDCAVNPDKLGVFCN